MNAPRKPTGHGVVSKTTRTKSARETAEPLPAALVQLLPAATTRTWQKLAPLSPTHAYLAGGTGLTVHLLHRVSRDLDMMMEQDEDLGVFADTLSSAGEMFVTHLDADSLNGVFDGTKVQFLRAATQTLLRPTTVVGGLRVASIEDITAMKLKVVLDRGELRDYFDLMCVDEQTNIHLEEGVGLFLARYGIGGDDPRVMMLVRSLGYLDDVADDPALPVSRTQIEKFWAKRQPALVRSLGRF